MATTRAPAGAARPSERVDSAVRRAVIDEMIEVGYAATSMEAVARRAGVGKAALYRRWPSKREMLLSVIGEVSASPEALADTGSLYGDVLAYLRGGRGTLGARARVLLPELVCAGARDADFRERVEATVYEPRRALLRGMMSAAVERGEIPPDSDLDVAVDVLVGANFWRFAVKARELSEESIAGLAAAVVRAAGGTPPP